MGPHGRVDDRDFARRRNSNSTCRVPALRARNRRFQSRIGFVRIALVADEDQVDEAARRIVQLGCGSKRVRPAAGRGFQSPGQLKRK